MEQLRQAADVILPVEIEQITGDWLTSALRAHAPEVSVRGFEIVDVIRSTCTKIRIGLELANNRADAPIPSSVILKGGFEPHSRTMGYMHEKEVRAYAELLPALGLRRPECYFAAYDAQAGQGIVILEDLVQRGVEFCSPLKPQNFEQVARRLEDLARFHAASWDSPDFQNGRRWAWVEDTLADTHRYFGAYLTEEVWRGFIHSPRGAAASVRFHDLGWMIDSLRRMAIYSARLPHCVNHTDTHLGNLYVDRDGQPGFYDSLAGRGPAMLEVAYHLGCALDTADRSRLEGALIQHYLDALAQAGVAPPSFDDALHQYGAFLAYGYAIFIINEAFFQSEANNTAYTARFSAAMIDHDTIGKLAAIS